MSFPTSASVVGIEHGSVFVLARWSGASVSALQHLQHAWAEAGLPDSDLHILDWEEHPSLGQLPELAGKIHGWGEAFQVLDGVITHFHVLGHKDSDVTDEVQKFFQTRNP